MTGSFKMLNLLVTFAFLATFVPGGLAGPACAKRLKGTQDCVEKCAAKWGWPGASMGDDPWGAVIKQMSPAEASAMIEKACGVSTSSVSSGLSSGASSDVSSSIATQAATLRPVANPISISVISPKPSSSSSSSRPTTSGFSSVRSSSSSSSRSTTSSTPNPSTSTKTSSSSVTKSTATVGTPSSSVKPSPTSSARPSSSSSSSSKAASTSSSSTSTSSGAGASGSTSASDISAYLSNHNTVRAQHGAVPLTWNDTLAAKAQQWANGCVFQHSGGSLGPYGENLAAGTGSGYGIPQAINSWAVEVSNYDSSNPQPSHFTQMVWKATTQLGCAVQSCNGIFPASYGPAKYYVCEYFVQGNVIGQFPQNVQA